MTKTRDLSNLVSDGSPFADGLLEVSDISDITATAAEVNILDGATVSTAELNILDGVTATATELNFVDGVTSAIQTQLNAKVAKTGDTGAALIPVGTEAQRPTPAAGQLRFNSDASTFEGYDGTEWGSVGGGGGATLEAVASGTLPNGAPVIINTDGTVSTVSRFITDEPSAGDQVNFMTPAGDNIDVESLGATFDSNSNKIVIFYRGGGNVLYPHAIVGTVSGTSISFGTPVVIYSNNNFLYSSATFDSNSNKVVLAYRFGGDIKAIVGTVSGTSISFGTAATYGTSSSSSISATFDSNLNKVVIAYSNGYNGPGTAVVGTVSGTSISFGSPVVFDSSTSNFIATTFDSNSNKVVIAYQDGGNSSFGTAIVGTVSGTSISFGTPVVFESADTQSISATFDSNSNKVVIAYKDVGNSSFGTAIVGTVSGTSISFGTPVVFRSTTTTLTSATFDSSSNRVVIGGTSYAIVGTVSGTSISFGSTVYANGGATAIVATFDSDYNRVVFAFRGSSFSGWVNVFRSTDFGTTLTAENYLGLSADAYADAATATVQLIGSVNEAQSGLTTGLRHFVQADGTLATTPIDPEVYAGLAVSATKLIVKG